MLIASLVFSFAMEGAAAEDIAGKMDCGVRSNQISAVGDEHLAKSISSFDDLEAGDALLFQYSLVGIDEVPLVEVQIVDELRGEILLNRSSLVRAATEGEGIVSDIESEDFDIFFVPVVLLDPEEIHIELDGATLALRRIYQGDWKGVVTNVIYDPLATQTFAIDCRQRDDRINDIIATVRQQD